jgi:hypothetical protein
MAPPINRSSNPNPTFAPTAGSPTSPPPTPAATEEELVVFPVMTYHSLFLFPIFSLILPLFNYANIPTVKFTIIGTSTLPNLFIKYSYLAVYLVF